MLQILEHVKLINPKDYNVADREVSKVSAGSICLGTLNNCYSLGDASISPICQLMNEEQKKQHSRYIN